MTEIQPPDVRLMDAAQAIHADNLHLLDRLAASDCNPGIELDDTLNGAQEHIFRFFEALALYDYGTVPWRSVEFMLESTDALMQAVEARFRMPSAHAVGRAFRASKIWWCVDEPAPKVSRKAYLKHIFAARDSFYAALNTFNCDIFCQGSPPPAQTPPQRAATKSDLSARYGEVATADRVFTSDDRKLLRQIHRATVYGEALTDARLAGDVRRKQVAYGLSLYKPSSRHAKGLSYTQAARKAIDAPQFSGVDGAYSHGELKALAKAIQRAYNQGDSAT